MQAMAQDHLPIFDKTEVMGGGKYVLDLDKWTQKMRTEIVENLIREKVGEVAVRIWRLLADKKMLDDKQVSKLALVDEKVARGNLYSMLKAGLVFIQVFYN
jgi:DNA-directed RNA polymerase III subunit RPC3